MVKLIQTLAILTVLISDVKANEVELELPPNAESYNLEIYKIKANTSLENALKKWTKKKWGSESLQWSLGNFESVKSININSKISYEVDFENSLRSLMKNLNNSSFVKKAGVVIYSCIFANDVLLVKAESLESKKNRCNQ